MGCEGPELTGLCLLVITFFRKHVYTCGEARVIPSILGPLLCRWPLRGGTTPRLCPRRGGPLGPPRDVTGVPNSLSFAFCPHILPAGQQQFKKHLGLPIVRDAHVKTRCPPRGRAL